VNRSWSAATVDVEFELKTPVRSRAANGGQTPPTTGTTPRLARLMALAIKCRDLVEGGDVKDYAALARAGYITRARMSQIMNLINLAPDIQEEILFLPKTSGSRGALPETALRKITRQPLWDRQRAEWRKLRREK